MFDVEPLVETEFTALSTVYVTSPSLVTFATYFVTSGLNAGYISVADIPVRYAADSIGAVPSEASAFSEML